MEIEGLTALTPVELYSIQSKREEENNKEFNAVKDYFMAHLRQELDEEIKAGKVVICQTRLSLSRMQRRRGFSPVIIDTSILSRKCVLIRIFFANGLEGEVEVLIGSKAVLVTRIIPCGSHEFQKLKYSLSDWESCSKYFPGKDEHTMNLYKVEDCEGKTIKEMNKIIISKIKEIIYGVIRLEKL